MKEEKKQIIKKINNIEQIQVNSMGNSFCEMIQYLESNILLKKRMEREKVMEILKKEEERMTNKKVMYI